MSGKLRQANRRGLLSDEQLNALLALVDVWKPLKLLNEATIIILVCIPVFLL